MLTSRALLVAVASFLVFWFAFDSGIVHQEPAPSGRLLALGVLAAVFTVSAMVMQAAGQTKRVPMFFGLALGLATYLLTKAVVP